MGEPVYMSMTPEEEFMAFVNEKPLNFEVSRDIFIDFVDMPVAPAASDEGIFIY